MIGKHRVLGASVAAFFLFLFLSIDGSINRCEADGRGAMMILESRSSYGLLGSSLEFEELLEIRNSCFERGNIIRWVKNEILEFFFVL